MEYCELFSILNQVDSTNNYAMGQAHEGLAKHGMAWFSRHQTAGKGQRGKAWQSTPGQNLILTVAVIPPPGIPPSHFPFSAAIALTVFRTFQKWAGNDCAIKWPNDIYWRDRKAGGILIENIIRGTRWNWCIIGVGININQADFDPSLPNPVSLSQITGESFDPLELAKELHLEIMKTTDHFKNIDEKEIISSYNEVLYKNESRVKLLKGNQELHCIIEGVDEKGRLHTNPGGIHNFGEVEWLF